MNERRPGLVELWWVSCWVRWVWVAFESSRGARYDDEVSLLTVHLVRDIGTLSVGSSGVKKQHCTVWELDCMASQESAEVQASHRVSL